MVFVRAAVTASILLLAQGGVPSARAADVAGRFALEGAGIADCSRFAQAYAEGSDETLLFAGWVHGYVSAFNQLQPDTFDIVPWQEADLLLASLADYCASNTGIRFFDAVGAMIRLLVADRITAQSPVVEIRTHEGAIRLYETTIAAVKAKLNAAGFDAGAPGAAFDESASKALAAFQAQRGLAATGLPDQATLKALLY